MDDKIDDGSFDYEKDYACLNSEHTGYASIEENGITREYILHIPASYDSTASTPLVISFHGFGGCASNFVDEAGDLNLVADSGNFIVAYPQATGGEKGDSYWDPGNDGSQSIGENDTYFTEQLIAQISNEYNVDSNRVYAIGYSNGGMMSYGLACTQGKLFAAVGIMSGIMLDSSCDEGEQTSVVHFHGVGDYVLPYDGNGDYQSVQDVMDFWVNHNGIPSSSLVTMDLNGGDVTRDVYTDDNLDKSVVLYTINSQYGSAGGHVWFSADIDGKSPNVVLWEFLSTYSLED